MFKAGVSNTEEKKVESLKIFWLARVICLIFVGLRFLTHSLYPLMFMLLTSFKPSTWTISWFIFCFFDFHDDLWLTRFIFGWLNFIFTQSLFRFVLNFLLAVDKTWLYSVWSIELLFKTLIRVHGKISFRSLVIEISMTSCHGFGPTKVN